MRKIFNSITEMNQEELSFINKGDNVNVSVYFDQETYREQMIFEVEKTDDVIYIANRLIFNETIQNIIVETFTYNELLEKEKEKLEEYVILREYVDDKPNMTLREYSRFVKELKTSDKLKYEIYAYYNKKMSKKGLM